MNSSDSNERGQIGPTPVEPILFVIVALVITVIAVQAMGVGSIGPSQSEIEQTEAEASAYCSQVYGDSELILVQANGGHGGYHCIANAHGPHLHEIPEEYKEEALRAQRRGDDLGWDLEAAYQHDSEKPDEIPLLGIYPRELPMVGGVVAGVITIVAGIAFVQRFREPEEAGKTG